MQYQFDGLKIGEAKMLLAEGRSVTQVAQELSFSTSSYFTYVFRKYTMHTPSEYIRQKRSEGQIT